MSTLSSFCFQRSNEYAFRLRTPQLWDEVPVIFGGQDKVEGLKNSVKLRLFKIELITLSCEVVNTNCSLRIFVIIY